MLSLLNDEDNSIYLTIHEHLLKTGEAALPFMEEYLESDDPLLRARVKKVYDEIAAIAFKDQWRLFCSNRAKDLDLEEGAFLIAKFGYPRTDMRTYADLLNFYASEFQARLDLSDDPEETAAKISRFFVIEKGFKGCSSDYYSSEHHFINKVMETKNGVPITLSVIYMLVLQRLNFPIHGIGMPGHFIVRYNLHGRHIFVDPYHEGKILTVDDCKKLLIQMGYSYKNEYLEPVSNRQIIERMLRNLILVFDKRNEPSKVQALTECIDILNMIF